MGNVFAYARVSTPRQGEKGVSLQEQRDAITRYAEKHGLEITRWFEERESAAKKGRAAFNQMLRLLRLRAADGVIIHKIDRSARNLEDWNDIGKLVDAGVKVYFATESIDLTTTAGRLSADIQAVVATHFSRNLREEVKKGMYGRLKQGFYPIGAPIGYLDQGSAKPKILDPVRAPLLKSAFELYATGEYALRELVTEMHRRGLRSRTGNAVAVNTMAVVLRNPFYIGWMRMGSKRQTFRGNHEPLISVALFDEVQDVLDGKRVDRAKQHVFTFSRIVRCASCKYSLIAERQKGHVYYRCHDRMFKNPAICPPTSIREEGIEDALICALGSIKLTDEELDQARHYLADQRRAKGEEREIAKNALVQQIEQLRPRISRLMDLLLEGTIDKDLFDLKRTALLHEQAAAEEKLRELETDSNAWANEVAKTVELAKDAYSLYQTASTQNKRQLLKIVLSNLTVSGKNVEITLSPAFQMIAKRQNDEEGRLNRGNCRTWELTLNQLNDYFLNGLATGTA